MLEAWGNSFFERLEKLGELVPTETTARFPCSSRHPEFVQRTTIPSGRGLKDHEIQELVNVLRDALEPYTQVQCLREVISKNCMHYLELKGLRVDKQ